VKRVSLSEGQALGPGVFLQLLLLVLYACSGLKNLFVVSWCTCAYNLARSYGGIILAIYGSLHYKTYIRFVNWTRVVARISFVLRGIRTITFLKLRGS
jgi:hypothetical protein